MAVSTTELMELQVALDRFDSQSERSIRAQRLKRAQAEWQAACDAIASANQSAEAWWDAVLGKSSVLIRSRTRLMDQVFGDESVPNLPVIEVPALSNEHLDSDEPLAMWMFAQALDRFSARALVSQIGDVEAGAIETVAKLVWVVTVRDAFNQVLRDRLDSTGISLGALIPPCEWHMIALYLLAQQQAGLLRDLGVVLDGAPVENSAVRNARIVRVYDLARAVNRPLTERVGTFERPLPGFKSLVRRWDKDTEEPFVQSRGVAAKTLISELASGASASEVAEWYGVSVRAVEEAQTYFEDLG